MKWLSLLLLQTIHGCKVLFYSLQVKTNASAVTNKDCLAYLISIHPWIHTYALTAEIALGETGGGGGA
jgi:hypothetical protein